MEVPYRQWQYQTVSNWASTDSGQNVNSTKNRLWGAERCLKEHLRSDAVTRPPGMGPPQLWAAHARASPPSRWRISPISNLNCVLRDRCNGLSLSPCPLSHVWQSPAGASCASYFHVRWPYCVAAMLHSSWWWPGLAGGSSPLLTEPSVWIG